MGAGESSGGRAGVWSRIFRVKDTCFLRSKVERHMHLSDWSLVGISGHKRAKVPGLSSGHLTLRLQDKRRERDKETEEGGPGTCDEKG